MRLKNKIIMITGSSRGIGKATAIRFAAEGATVILIARNENDLKAVASIIRNNGGKCIYFATSVIDKVGIDNVIKQVIDRYLKIDILINNAGITSDDRLENMTLNQWEEVVDINMKGTFICTQAVIPIMKEQKNGVILNASSVVGVYGNFGQTNYAASKWGVIGMTKTWAREFGKYGIRVNAVAPGFTMTEMIKKMPEKVLEQMKEKSLLKKIALPDDIANAYLFLASDESSFITGAVLNVDGGIVL